MAAAEFIEFLGNQLAKGTGGKICEGIETTFEEAVENLPQGELKTSLKKNFNRHLKKLLRYVKSVSKTHESSKGTKPMIKELNFNLYGRNSLEGILQSVSHLQSAESRESNCKRLWAACSVTEESEKLFKILRPPTISDEESDDKKLESTIRIINTCKQMAIGHSSEQKVVSCMKFFLSEISPRCEECLDSNDKNRQKRAVALRDVLHDVLLVMHFRHQTIQDEDACSGNNEESFEDLLAAMLSLYIDMVLISVRTDQDKNKLAKSIGNFVLLLLGNSVGHCLDCLLQLSAVSDDNAEVILPLIRCALRRTTQADISCATYIKCICTAKLGLKHLGNNSQEERNDIKQVVESIGPPSQFVSWLSSKDEGLVKDLCLPVKRVGRKITRHLLDITNEDCFERLLDLTSDVHHARAIDNLGSGEDDDKEHPPDEIGFFFDSRGDAEIIDIAEEVVYTTSKAKEKILGKQLTSLRSRLHSHSESDSEADDQFDFDIEEVSKTTLGGVIEQKQNNGLDTDVPVESSIGATVDLQVEDADDALMESNVVAAVESQIADVDDSQMKSSVAKTVDLQVEDADDALMESSVVTPVESQIEDVDDSQMESSVATTVEIQVEDAYDVPMESSVIEPVESQIEDVDDSLMESGVATTVESQVEVECAGAKEQHAAQTKPKAVKKRTGKESKQLCTRTGMRTRGRASVIEVFKDEDVLHLTEVNVKDPTPAGKRRKSREITLHQVTESVKKSVSRKDTAVIKPRMSTRLRKRH